MKNTFSFAGIILSGIFLSSCSLSSNSMTDNKTIMTENAQTATFAGGCFWCMEPAFQEHEGVIDAVVGYAGGDEKDAKYTQVSAGKTQHRESVQVTYDPEKISYEELVQIFLQQIDPTDGGGQFADRGFQYTTAVYYHSLHQKEEAEEVLRFAEEQGDFDAPFAIIIEEFSTFFPAEEYHQNYYKKAADHYYRYKEGSGRGPFIEENWSRAAALWEMKKLEEEKTKQEKIKNLSDLEKNVLLQNGTERPFDNEYWNNKKEGIYVDKLSGEVLFSSADKFDSGTGWPSFTRPIHGENIEEIRDTSHGMIRTEVRAKESDTHLGHVFPDGPSDAGGMRYCINSASMEFIPKEEMEERGYGEYLELIIVDYENLSSSEKKLYDEVDDIPKKELYNL